MKEIVNAQALLGTIIYSFIGVGILVVCYWIIEKITPENLWKEIIEKQNKALAIVAGAFIIAIAVIVSAAIHG